MHGKFTNYINKLDFALHKSIAKVVFMDWSNWKERDQDAPTEELREHFAWHGLPVWSGDTWQHQWLRSQPL